MNFTTTINLHRVLFSGTALVSILGGMIFSNSVVAQQSPSLRTRRCYTYTLINRTNRGVDFNIDRRKSYLRPRGQLRIRRCFQRRPLHPLVKYDRIIGSGYRITTTRLAPGRNAFDSQGRILVLTTGKNRPTANLKVPVQSK
ncbi:MAG: hypothetical protein SAL70_12150 [Scytonema sp. PMC 1070.18]|nr:hypothetical protein [Scytonema sp. PMC 1070.18]